MKYDYILIKLRNIVLEAINNIIFIFNSYFVITAQSWHMHFFSLNLCRYLVQLGTISIRKRMDDSVPSLQTIPGRKIYDAVLIPNTYVLSKEDI